MLSHSTARVQRHRSPRAPVAILSAVALVVTLLAMPLATPAAADAGSYATGGQIHDLAARPLTASQLAIRDKKLAQLTADRKRLSAAAQFSAAWTASTVWADIFAEPLAWDPASRNWCGPGSTAAVVSNWNSKPENYNGTYAPAGGVGYLTWLAKDGSPGVGPEYYGGFTSDTRLQSTVNGEIGTWWYGIVACPTRGCTNGVGGLTNFQQYLYTEIATYRHPLFTVVWTSGLYGWGTYGVEHWQWVTFATTDSNLLTYGDSANSNASPNGTPYGYHNWTMSDYYNLQVQNSHVWDEIVW